MKIISLFDGKSGGMQALKRAGVEVDEYFASEIDRKAIEVSKKNYPEIVHIGDIRGVGKIEGIDMVIGGSPCQDLSRAKTDGKGLEGEKSSLFYEFVRVIKENKPEFFLLENVASMKKIYKDEMTRVLKEIYPETECYFIDSSLVSAQNRRRLYWTNIPNIIIPEDRGIKIRDIMEDIPEEDSMWEEVPKEYIQEGKVRIPEATKKGYVELEDFDSVDMAHAGSKTRRGRLMREKSNSLMTSAQFYHYRKINGKDLWRKFTRKELLRLQTMEDGYMDGLSYSAVQKLCGNGWTIEVIVEILKQLPKKYFIK